jgi:N-carbamoylputrescine amidase
VSALLRVTVCELHDEPDRFRDDWRALAAHVRDVASALVLLPEMPFGPWHAASPSFDAAAWDASVETHRRRLVEVAAFAPAVVVGSRPVTIEGRRLNEGFAWSAAAGYRAIHHKRFLPDEEGYWEAHWYEPGADDFRVVDVAGARAGMLICTEMWSMAHAQRYGKAGADLILTPRATGRPTVEKWIAGGRVSAIVAGAYSLSSNRSAEEGGGDFGGAGWIIDPDGHVLARTTPREPFATRDLDLSVAAAAKRTYPRYALE